MIETAPTKDNIATYKYAVKSAKPISASDKVELETSFKNMGPFKRHPHMGIYVTPFTA